MSPVLKILLARRVWVAGLMGFTCGLPLALTTGSLLQAWMTEEGVDITVIGLWALVGLPYTIKFLWSPFLDRYSIPFFGRRKGWILISQLGLMATTMLVGCQNPKQDPWFLALSCVFLAFFSASQDIVVDAYRREDLAEEELGLGSAFYIGGYRLGLLLANGGGLILAEFLPYRSVFFIMAACMLIGVITTLLTPEPQATHGVPRTLREAVIDPFIEFFSRRGVAIAGGILIFIVMYKIGDQMALQLTTPFYLQLGFSKLEIGVIVKTLGIWATIGGTFLGGMFMLKLGINRSLWVFGVLQSICILAFIALGEIGHSIAALTAVIAFENLSMGMGTAAYSAYMLSQTNKKFTATQYALLSSVMAIPRVFATSTTGYIQRSVGWPWFYAICTLIAIPGLIMLVKIAPWPKKT